jgi:polyferredoxin
MKTKLSQLIMVWLLPLIIIGGLIWPAIGLIVPCMILFFMMLSFFRRRYWCWHLCPRGSFLGIVMPYFSQKKRIPDVFTKIWFRAIVFIVLIGYLTALLIRADGNVFAIGDAFVVMCLITTVIGGLLGIVTKPRCWCVICPMGSLQEIISSMKPKIKEL